MNALIIGRVSPGSSPEPMRHAVKSVAEARELVRATVFAGWRDVTAEVYDSGGEVVAEYEHGAWREPG